MELFKRQNDRRRPPKDGTPFSFRAHVYYLAGPSLVELLGAMGFEQEDIAPLGDLTAPIRGTISGIWDDITPSLFEADGGLYLPAIDTRDGKLCLSRVLMGRANGFYGAEDNLILNYYLIPDVSPTTALENLLIGRDNWDIATREALGI